MGENIAFEALCGYTSYDVFMAFVKYHYIDGKPCCDASNIVGKDCYLAWLSTRKKQSVFPADVFRRTVIAHLTGTKKRKPFPQEVEESLLKTVRVRHVWPCFADVVDNNGKPVTFGHVGFRPRGYHEQVAASTTFKPPTLTAAAQLDQLPYDLESFTDGILDYDFPDFTLIESGDEVAFCEKPSCRHANVGPEMGLSNVHRDEVRMMRFFLDLPRVGL
eukprot:CAMPEP_0203754218 /NCGR_PEP_ID=MMETSP0098-20131031/7848_1 /ASSEMBLY_ACC=CAM_ASM_000208 /TAXON_ID=96639 /ORGANISM=" , Strain NY0313808BC1" /LENGTH=217 /DNA_ID=CAMNT_0050645127 /DNA_START=499 /DNA_END=1152 /DNA_ORIENTATION=-